MKKYSVVLLALGIVSGSMAMAAQQPSKPVQLHYELKLKSGAFGDMGVRKMWISGSEMRWESNSARLKLVLLKNKDGVFLVHPWKKIAAKYPEGTNRANPLQVFPGPAGPVQAFLTSIGAIKHGTEKVAGQYCSIYSYNAPGTKRLVRLWVGAKSGKPVQLRLKGVNGKADTVTAAYTCYDLGDSARSANFQLPEGYKIMPMPKLSPTSKKAGKTLAAKSGEPG